MWVPTDMVDYELRPCFFAENFIPLKDANLNVRTHALQYGTACFGGIRGYFNPEKKNVFVFRLEDHYNRLRASGRILQMKWDMSYERFRQITLEILQKGNWRENVYLRPLIYKSVLELSPRLHNAGDDFLMYAIPLNDYLDTKNGLSACISSWMRISDNQIPTRSKATGGYINSALAKSEALENGFDEAIFLDFRGFVSEGSAENIFIVRDNTLITPGLSSSILEGITRRSIIHLAEEMGYKVIERDISRTELYVANEAFFCGTGVQVAWIKSVDRRNIGEGKIGPITQKIQQEFFRIVRGDNDNYMSWLTSVW